MGSLVFGIPAWSREIVAMLSNDDEGFPRTPGCHWKAISKKLLGDSPTSANYRTISVSDRPLHSIPNMAIKPEWKMGYSSRHLSCPQH